MADPVEALRERWRSPEGIARARAVFEALTSRTPLSTLNLGRIDGRIDLRGIDLRGSAATGIDAKAAGLQARAAETLEFREVELRSTDFSSAVLVGWRITDGVIEDARFDGTDLRDFRAWGLVVTDSTFRTADLRGAVIGAVNGRRHSSYRRVDFSGADLRGIVSPGADFEDCNFSGAHLDGTDFQSSSFVRCRFAGRLADVIFWDHGFRTGKAAPNQMEDVDFDKATLHHVEFRRLNLDRVRFPASPDHVVIRAYRATLDRAIVELAGLDTPAGRRARALLEHRRRWAGPHQEVGVFNMTDLGDTDLDATWLADILRRCESDSLGE